MAIGSRLRGIIDELIATGYPDQVAERIATGDLPMDTASRMQRAEAMGFDPTVYYKGGGERGKGRLLELEDRSRPFFATSDPMLANSYNQVQGVEQVGAMYPLRIDTRDFATVDARGQGYRDIYRPTLTDSEGYALIDSGRVVDPRVSPSRTSPEAFTYSTDELAAAARQADAPGVIINDVVDLGFNYGSLDDAMQQSRGLRASDYVRLLDEQGANVIAVNPDTGGGMNKVRSLFSAAFDPEYTGSNILGERAIPVAGAGLLAAAALTPEETEAGVIKTFGREFDPRFDPRIKEQEKLRDTTFTIEERGTQDAPRIPLADLEGRPFVTTMSDRTQAGGLLTGIDDVALDRPINLQGGQGFMFENPGMVWASAPGVVNQIMRAASEVGDNPVYLPFRMAPTGGDFATMTGETMLSFASSNMNKTQKKALDKAIRDYESVGSMVKGKRVGAGFKIKDWKGVDDPSSVEVWRNTPDTLRKELMNMMDVQFRDQGGLSVGQARLAVTEPGQADALDAQIQNIGEIFTGKDVVQASGHPSYPAGVPGQGLGRTNQDVGIFELLTDARFGGQQRPVGDPQRPTAQEIRALQMKPYTGRITEDILRGLEARGVDVNANPFATAAAVSAGADLEGLLAQLPQKDEEAYSYGDILPIKRALNPEQREGLLGGYSPAYTGIVEDLVEGLLTFKTQAERGLYNPTAATEFLL